MRNRILEFVAEFVRQHGTSPTLREISRAVLGSSSPNAALHHLRALAAEGRIRLAPRGSGRASTVVVVGEQFDLEPGLLDAAYLLGIERGWRAARENDREALSHYKERGYCGSLEER